jgi:hypothetical protein
MTIQDVIDAGLARLDEGILVRYRAWGLSDAAMAHAGWSCAAHQAHCLQLSMSQRPGGFCSPERNSIAELSNTCQGYANWLEEAFGLWVLD